MKVLCSICNKTADAADPPVCNICAERVAMDYLGRFGQLHDDLKREKIAGANLADRMTKLTKVTEDRVAGLVSEHQLVESDLNGRIGRTLLHLTGLRYWPFRRVVENVIRILDGSG